MKPVIPWYSLLALGKTINLHSQPLLAFSHELLLDQRWLLDATGKSFNALWTAILTVDESKQELFMERDWPGVS